MCLEATSLSRASRAEARWPKHVPAAHPVLGRTGRGTDEVAAQVDPRVCDLLGPSSWAPTIPEDGGDPSSEQ